MRKRKEVGNSSIFDAKTGKLKHSHLATDEQDPNIVEKLWFDATIKPLLENKEAMDYIYDMPDREEYIKKVKEYPASKISDDDFFELIKLEPRLLWSRFAFEKIMRWREEMHDKNKDKAYEAQENLKKIGTSLAFKGHNRGLRIVEAVALERDKVYLAIKELGISRKRSDGMKKIELRKIFDGIDSLENIPATDKELANLITSRMFNLTPETVKKYCKMCKKVEGYSAVVLKNPK